MGTPKGAWQGSTGKDSTLNVENAGMERHPVPAGLDPKRVVSRALGAVVPWLFGVALFTYVDRSVFPLQNHIVSAEALFLLSCAHSATCPQSADERLHSALHNSV